MGRASATGGAIPLRPAPDAGQVPLPARFGLTPDPATTALDGGLVLLGGSPLRLLRLTAAGSDCCRRWSAGQPVGTGTAERRLARRLVRSGAFQPRPPSAEVPEVAVVVPVRDRPEALGRLLEALAGGELAGAPVVVVDDASERPQATEAVAARHGATVVRLGRHQGPGGARNAGLAATSAPVVVFLDSDCVPRPGWLAPLAAHLADPLVALVAPRVVPATGPPGWLARYEAVRSSLDQGPEPGLVRHGSRLGYVPSAALVARRSALGPAPFDPGLVGGEDVDLVWRLADAGWDVRYEPAAVVEHDPLPTARAWLGRRAFYGTTAGPLARRHPGRLAPVAVSAWTAGTWALLAARRPSAAAGLLGISTAVLARRLEGVVDRPVPVAARLAGSGSVRAVVPVAGGLTRAYGPLLLAALASRRLRPAAAVALAAPVVADYRRQRPDLDPLRYALAHLADDLAYGAGLWAGCWRERTWAPLIPQLPLNAPEWSRRGVRPPSSG